MAFLKHRAISEVERVERHLLEAVGNAAVLGQEARPHAVAARRESQVERRRLDLRRRDCRGGGEGALLDQGADLLMYEDAVGHPGDGSERSGALKELRGTVWYSVRGELLRSLTLVVQWGLDVLATIEFGAGRRIQNRASTRVLFLLSTS